MNRISEHLQWIALTAVGLIAGLALALPLGAPIFAVLGAMAGTPAVLGIIGLVLGSAQSQVIRRHSASPAWWIVASTAGMAIGLTLGVIVVEQIGRKIVGGPLNFRMIGVSARALSFAVIGMIGGSSLGFAQWLVLRRLSTNCKRWITANGVSLAAGLACGSLLADAITQKAGSLLGVGIMLAFGSILMGIYTARVLTQVFVSSTSTAK